MYRIDVIKERYPNRSDIEITSSCPGTFNLGPVIDTKSFYSSDDRSTLSDHKLMGCRKISCYTCWHQKI